MEPTELFILALKQELRKKKISQKELADMIGTDYPNMSQCLKGKRNFSEKRKMKIVELLGLNYAKLIADGYRLKYNIDPKINISKTDNEMSDNMVPKETFDKEVKQKEIFIDTIGVYKEKVDFLERRIKQLEDENKAAKKKLEELKKEKKDQGG